MTTRDKNNETNARDINRVWLRGEVIEPITISHTLGDRTFWKTKISCTRMSGIKDIIPVITSKKSEISVGDTVSLNGEMRIHAHQEDGTYKRRRYVYAYTLYRAKKEDHRDIITIEGVVTREPAYRVTPKGREITDLMVRSRGNNIPCICWWNNAKKAQDLAVGSKVRVRGAIQSRDYTKKTANHIDVLQIIEVSVRTLDILPEEESEDIPSSGPVISAPDGE